ncbi:MAG: shikimate kinase [Verrucomicrobiota bacterium]|jgi:shikimate kinase|nr:shikimate kinase [Verrucomicrobiota bacterium]
MNNQHNLVLLGFMGTGKSAAGRKLAALTCAPLLDMDAEVERRAGKSIARIFEEDGEAVFRRMEAELAAEWGAQKAGAIIVCGGGVVLNEENLRQLSRHGKLVCLTARPEVIIRRVAGHDERPLLQGGRLEQQVATLLEERKEAYERIPIQVDTSDLDMDSLSARLIRVWRHASS